jgi:hypothetical protein
MNQYKVKIVHQMFQQLLFFHHHKNLQLLLNLLEQQLFVKMLVRELKSNKQHVYQEYSKDEHVYINTKKKKNIQIKIKDFFYLPI